MRVLVFGAEGMLGRELMRDAAFFGASYRPVTWDKRIMPGADISKQDELRRAFDIIAPDVVINCAGIVKSECESYSENRVFEVNGGAPHLIADEAESRGCRFIHISSDCVFDGSRGMRTEDDFPDAKDVYGRSKAMGEVDDKRTAVTLRTSFVGPDPRHRRGLLEWLLASADAPGYARVMWSGLSVIEVARAISLVLERPALCGLFNVAGAPISKFDLLHVLARAFELDVEIQREERTFSDRTLDGSRFRAATGFVAPEWRTMAEALGKAKWVR